MPIRTTSESISTLPQKGRLWKSPLKGSKLATKFLTAALPTVSCLPSLHIEKVSGIFPIASTQVAKGKKNPDFRRSKEQRLPARIVSGAGSLKNPGSLKSGIGEGRCQPKTPTLDCVLVRVKVGDSHTIPGISYA